MCIRPVMTYACPVLLTPPRLHSKTFRSFKINFVEERLAHNAAASYEAPPENHFLRRPRNALSHPPDDLTAEVEELNKALENLME
ncbi:hypothetical protein EVAR_78199_1 [Eumeta japonica]|uniref:Uncharacterized protein n=1 Tax=Eumeta variegata TaxID=151549 RepID=A0A4C1UZG1_EUMVA|nr:hypothetical protein EVAR_78199_1 [Eumeta japonica]